MAAQLSLSLLWAGLWVVWAEREVRSQAGKMEWVESHMGNFWDVFWSLGMLLPTRFGMDLGVMPHLMLLLLPWLLIWTKRLLGKEESLEAKKLPFCAYTQSSQGLQEKPAEAGLNLNNSVELDLGNLAQLLLWVFQLVNALPEPETELSAVGRWLLLSSELLTASGPKGGKVAPHAPCWAQVKRDLPVAAAFYADWHH